MSGADPDALAEMARNRGLKLVRSRVRTPGKLRFGKVGLTDARGRAVFGMDDKGPNSKPEDVEDYLRNLGAKDWGASLDVAVMPRKKKPKSARQAANDAEPEPKREAPSPPPSKPKSKPKVRDAKPSDAARLTELIRTLGHEVSEKDVRKNLGKLKKLGELPLVAVEDKKVVGLCGVHRMNPIHRSAPVGRITILVVASEAQKRGIGRLLVNAAEQWCRDKGCGLIEVTSNDRLGRAHAFYRQMDFERTSIRFCKKS